MLKLLFIFIFSITLAHAAELKTSITLPDYKMDGDEKLSVCELGTAVKVFN